MYEYVINTEKLATFTNTLAVNFVQLYYLCASTHSDFWTNNPPLNASSYIIMNNTNRKSIRFIHQRGSKPETRIVVLDLLVIDLNNGD